MKLFRVEEKGQGLVEYALILVLVAIVVLAILLVLGPGVGNVFSSVVTFLDSAAGGGSGGQQITFVGTPAIGKMPSGWGGCTYYPSAVQVRVTQGSNPVSGAAVSAGVSVRDSDGHGLTSFSISGTTGGSGQTYLAGTSSSAGCGGHEATVSVNGGPSQTVIIP